ncbi:MAG: hypothetical protein QXF56_03305 [Candidatus Micrarchaeia archaeon]
MGIQKVPIKTTYYVHLALINLISILLHELGHALAVILAGGRLVSYELVRIIPEPSFIHNFYALLGGPIVTAMLCFLATYQFFKDRTNSAKWLAAIFSNFGPLISLMIYLLAGPNQDELYIFIHEMKMPPLLFFSIYLALFSFPLAILINAPRLSARKKVAFYLNNIAIILSEIALLSVLNRLIFGR